MFLEFCFSWYMYFNLLHSEHLRCLDILVYKFMFSATLSDNGFGERGKGQTFPQVSEFESAELCLLLFHGFAPLRRNCLDTHHPAEVCCNPPNPGSLGKDWGSEYPSAPEYLVSPLFFINSLQHTLYTFLHGEA